MKFISKNSNLRIVLSPGLPAEPISGRISVPGVYVKFQDGIAEVTNKESIEKMKNHKAFNVDFISGEDEVSDPYEDFRKNSEPDHFHSELKFGQIIKSQASKRKVKLPKELQTLIDLKIRAGIEAGLKAVLLTDVSDVEEITEDIAKDVVEDVVEDKEETISSNEVIKNRIENNEPNQNRPVEVNELISKEQKIEEPVVKPIVKKQGAAKVKTTKK